jgi:hypothetical protein
MNTMTLGGLALAIGILVDDATVTIENIHRHMNYQPLREAVLIGASEIATPTLVSTLTIYLHRLCLGSLLNGSRKISLHADGACGCLRHARVLCPFKNARSSVG